MICPSKQDIHQTNAVVRVDRVECFADADENVINVTFDFAIYLCSQKDNIKKCYPRKKRNHWEIFALSNFSVVLLVEKINRKIVSDIAVIKLPCLSLTAQETKDSSPIK